MFSDRYLDVPGRLRPPHFLFENDARQRSQSQLIPELLIHLCSLDEKPEYHHTTVGSSRFIGAAARL